MNNIFKILTPNEWADFNQEGTFAGSELDKASGFIHASLEGQTGGVLERFYSGVRPLMLVEIDPKKLPEGSLILEANRPGGDQYPHIYGVLPKSAVVGVTTLSEPAFKLKV